MVSLKAWKMVAWKVQEMVESMAARTVARLVVLKASSKVDLMDVLRAA